MLTAPGLTAKSERNISGVWWTSTYTPSLVPVEGGVPPLTEAGRKFHDEYKAAFATRSFEDPMAVKGVVSYKQFVEKLKEGPVLNLKMHDPEFRPNLRPTPENIIDSSLRRCVPAGPVRSMAAPYPFRIIHSPANLITIAYEMNRAVRSVRLDVQHANPEVWPSSYMGESVGWWEGGTLVIDTINFNALTTLDRSGLPHSEELHVIERLRLINGGKQLEALITIEDPVMYTRPWTTRLVYESRNDIRPRTDQTCDEPHRDLTGQVKDIEEAQAELRLHGGRQ